MLNLMYYGTSRCKTKSCKSKLWERMERERVGVNKKKKNIVKIEHLVLIIEKITVKVGLNLCKERQQAK